VDSSCSHPHTNRSQMQAQPPPCNAYAPEYASLSRYYKLKTLSTPRKSFSLGVARFIFLTFVRAQLSHDSHACSSAFSSQHVSHATVQTRCTCYFVPQLLSPLNDLTFMSNMNLTSCSEKFASSPNWQLYGYLSNDTGLPGEQRVISRSGCQALCGLGADTYDWMSIANSIATWVFLSLAYSYRLPSKATIPRVRYFRSFDGLDPPSALSPYNERPSEGSDFSSIRDSFYILAVMNQYTINPKMRIPTHGPDVAEKLLRAALFDEILEVKGEKLPALRKRTASRLRESRKQGVVAVFISMGWFLFSLAISIQAGNYNHPDRISDLRKD
jgi:hypothetical protein